MTTTLIASAVGQNNRSTIFFVRDGLISIYEAQDEPEDTSRRTNYSQRFLTMGTDPSDKSQRVQATSLFIAALTYPGDGGAAVRYPT